MKRLAFEPETVRLLEWTGIAIIGQNALEQKMTASVGGKSKLQSDASLAGIDPCEGICGRLAGPVRWWGIPYLDVADVEAGHEEFGRCPNLNCVSRDVV